MQCNSADFKRVARLDFRFLDSLPVYRDSVCRIQVGERDTIIGEIDLRVVARNPPLGEDDVIRGRASQRDERLVEDKFLMRAVWLAEN